MFLSSIGAGDDRFDDMTGGVRGLEFDPRDLFEVVSTGCTAENTEH